jgi:putative ABC transport system ATP-binding protein
VPVGALALVALSALALTGAAAAVHAVAGVSLTVARGEFVSVMGPSGSGKSTLLHLIGGLDVPTSGTVTIDGRLLSALDDDALTLFRRRHVGFVVQAFNLLPTLTAEENVALPLLLDRVSRKDVRTRVERVLALVGLEHRRDHRPEALSGGEMQRVALARALVVEPLVLLADEPTGNLDSATGAAILAELRATARRLAQTVVMVTHDPHAAAIGDRVVSMIDGRVPTRATARVGEGREGGAPVESAGAVPRPAKPARQTR